MFWIFLSTTIATQVIQFKLKDTHLSDSVTLIIMTPGSWVFESLNVIDIFVDTIKWDKWKCLPVCLSVYMECMILEY